MRFIKHLTAILALTCLSFTAAVGAESLEPVAGTHYKLIQPPQPTQIASKIEVVEVFWYGCPHCNDLEPILKEWLSSKPEDVLFRRVPAVFRDSWEPHAKAYYAAEALGVADKVNGPIFDAIHKENKKLDDVNALSEVVAAQGVDKAKFKEAFEAFATKTKVVQGVDATKRYGVMGVPAMVVNGKYLVTAKTAGSNEAMLRVVSALVDKERKMVAPAKPAAK